MTFLEAAAIMMGDTGGGGDVDIGPLNIDITQNGSYSYLASEYDLDGFDPVNINANVPDRYAEGFQDGYKRRIDEELGNTSPEDVNGPSDPEGNPQWTYTFPNGTYPSDPNDPNKALTGGGLIPYIVPGEDGTASYTNPNSKWSFVIEFTATGYHAKLVNNESGVWFGCFGQDNGGIGNVTHQLDNYYWNDSEGTWYYTQTYYRNGTYWKTENLKILNYSSANIVREILNGPGYAANGVPIYQAS